VAMFNKVKRPNKSFPLVLVLIIFSSVCWGQKLLFHKNRFRQALYKEGDVISFKVKDDRSKITAQIKGFKDSVIVFESFEVNPSRITHLYVDSKTKTWYILRYKYEKIFLIAGLAYPLLELINQGQLDKETLMISGTLIAAGLLARWLIDDKIKIKGRRRMLIID
jgi:hypothetical protein